jgi:phage shock protein C
MSGRDDWREERRRAKWERRREKWERREQRREDRRQWRSAEATEPANPHRLYRDNVRRKVRGVCAGIADYFGIDPLPLRVTVLVAAVLFPFPVIPGYFILSWILPRRPPQLYATPADEQMWREVTIAPDRSFYALKFKFRDLEARLARMEADVTSEEFDLRRKFRDIGA